MNPESTIGTIETMTENWTLSGSYFETRNCETACPCVFLSPPSTGECDVLVAWHIDKGNMGKVDLGGLNAALAVHSPGEMTKVKWDAAVYLDSKANDEQRNALTEIFGGKAGGHPSVLASFVGKVLGVDSVKFDYSASGKKRSLRIPSKVEAEIEAIEGQGGSLVTISNQPLCISPGESAVVARSKKLSYHDHGMDWEVNEKNGFYSPFSYEGH